MPQPQPSPQGREEGWSECQVTLQFLLEIGLIVEFKMFQMFEQSNEVQNLPVGPFGFSEVELSDSW